MKRILPDTNVYSRYLLGDIANLHNFLRIAKVDSVAVTYATVKLFGGIKNDLSKQGRMIPLNDI
jgi:hypothetical protein